MNGPLSRDTAERMLRGERTGPPALADLLAAAAATPVDDDPVAEEAAVAAFRVARIAGTSQRARRRPRLLSFKTAVLGLLLALAGGVTAVTVANRQADPPAHRHSPATHEPVTSRTAGSRGDAATPRRNGGPRPTGPHGTPAPKAGDVPGQNAGRNAAGARQKVRGDHRTNPPGRHKGGSNGNGNG